MLGQAMRYLVPLCAAIVSIAFVGNGTAGNEDRTFERQRLELVEKIEQILIENKVCQSKADCQRKQVLFANPQSGGVGIDIYEVRDEQVIKEVSDICSKTFFVNPEMKVISVGIIEGSKSEELAKSFWAKTKINISIEYRRKK